MRILHTSDWHVGRTFHGSSLLDHQHTVLGSLVETARSERVDVVVIAGDLYDRAVPGPDAVALLSATLCELRATGATVIAIPGNHDSSARLGFAADVLARGGVHLRTADPPSGTPVLFPGPEGEPGLAVYTVPYVHPHESSHQAVLTAAANAARDDLAGRGPVASLLVAHAFVSGGQGSESERVLSVGGSGEVGMACLRGFDYVALGHLHGRQTLGSGRVRYSGSPLAYSFSERHHSKGGWILDLHPGCPPEVVPFDFPVPRPLAVVEGSVEELLLSGPLSAAETSWVQAVVTDAVLAPDAVGRLRHRFPFLANLVHRPPVGEIGTGSSRSYAHRTKGRSDLELFADFWAHATGQTAPAEVENTYCEAATAAAAALATEAGAPGPASDPSEAAA